MWQQCFLTCITLEDPVTEGELIETSHLMPAVFCPAPLGGLEGVSSRFSAPIEVQRYTPHYSFEITLATTQCSRKADPPESQP